MKKLIVIFLLTMGIFFACVLMVNAQEQRMNFRMNPGQEVQKFVNFSFVAPWDCVTYRLEVGNPFFNQKGCWREIPVGGYSGPGQGFYRFIAGDNKAEVDIYGETQPLSGYLEDMDCDDVSLMIKDIWASFYINLPPRNGETGSYDYSYHWLCPGWGTSMCLATANQYTDFSGKFVGVITFNNAGFPERIMLAGSKELTDKWINPGEIALIIHYQGNNWRVDKKIFSTAIKTTNQIFKELSN